MGFGLCSIDAQLSVLTRYSGARVSRANSSHRTLDRPTDRACVRASVYVPVCVCVCLVRHSSARGLIPTQSWVGQAVGHFWLCGRACSRRLQMCVSVGLGPSKIRPEEHARECAHVQLFVYRCISQGVCACIE